MIESGVAAFGRVARHLLRAKTMGVHMDATCDLKVWLFDWVPIYYRGLAFTKDVRVRGLDFFDQARQDFCIAFSHI